MLRQFHPASEAYRTRLIWPRVEDADTGLGDACLFHSLQQGVEQLGFTDEESGLGNCHVVPEFMGSIAWICPSKDSPGADDGEDQDGVVDIIERVDDHAVSLSHASVAEACDQLADGSACLQVRD